MDQNCQTVSVSSNVTDVIPLGYLNREFAEFTLIE